MTNIGLPASNHHWIIFFLIIQWGVTILNMKHLVQFFLVTLFFFLFSQTDVKPDVNLEI